MKIKIILLFFTSVYLLNAQQELIVNTNTDFDQKEPVIEIINSLQNFAVVWNSNNQIDSLSKDDIFLKIYDKDLTEILSETAVNDSTLGSQINPQIASNSDGKFVIVWSSYNEINFNNFYDIKLKLFSNNEAYSEEILVNNYTDHSQTKPQVAMNEMGEFIVVWESWEQDGSDRGVYGQNFDADGNKIGDEFRVNSTTLFSQARPKVKFLDNEKYIIVWESWMEDDLGYDLYGKIYGSTGELIQDEFQINSYEPNNQWYADIGVRTDGFDIVWCSWEQDGYDGGIYLKSFDENYTAEFDEILINSSTQFYQWLPKISNLQNGNKAIVWSSWNLDGSREGLFYKVLDKNNKELTLENRINSNTNSYQWEPDFIETDLNELVAVWSSYGELNNDYEVMINKFSPEYLIGEIDKTEYIHSNGNSSSNFVVHVMDSTKLTGHIYSIEFQEIDEETLGFIIMDRTIDEIKVELYPLYFKEGVKYLTEQFDGVVIEFIPNFELKLDFENSYFVNNSESNFSFEVENPTIFPAIAPIDISLIWGSTDTLETGNYVSPSDTALSQSNIREIEVPFYAVNKFTKESIDILILESSNTQNNKWDFGETIVFLTPEEYRTNTIGTHAQLLSSSESENLVYPSIGDTNYILTYKPITSDDVYQFATSKEKIILGIENLEKFESFYLLQNYPNPFNPVTTIKYSVPLEVKSDASVSSATSAEGRNVILKVFDILGREVETLVNKDQKSGNYSIEFNGSHLSSGVYFYSLQIGMSRIIKKMMLLK